jgi:hypothetical protein
MKNYIISNLAGPRAGLGNEMHGYCHYKVFADLMDSDLLIYNKSKTFNNNIYKTLNDIFENNFSFTKKRRTISFPRSYDSSSKSEVLKKFKINIPEEEYLKMFLKNFLDFKFVKPIRNDADKFIANHFNHEDETIGVHIRTGPGGAKERYLIETDIDNCVINIQKYLNIYNLQSIFLTGGKMYNLIKGIKNRLRASGVNVISDESSSYSRDSSEWLRDMEILSRCKCVIGHMNSTFSTASARIKGKDFISLKNGEVVCLPHTH